MIIRRTRLSIRHPPQNRHAQPEIEPDQDWVPLTPHDTALIQRRNEVTEFERQRWVKQTSGPCQRVAECYQDIELVSEQLEKDEQALAAADQPLSEAALGQRRANEDRFDTTVIHHRRAAEHRKGLAPLRDAVATTQARLNFLYIQRANIEADIVSDLRQAQSRGQQTCHFTEGLRNRYWRALIRSHPDGKRILGKVPPPVDIPSWITERDYRIVLGIELPRPEDRGGYPLS